MIHGARPHSVLIAVRLIFIFALVAFLIFWSGLPFVPESGVVTSRSSYPAFFPFTEDTPLRYTIVISSNDRKSTVSWQVDAQTYALYEVGDVVRRGEVRFPHGQ